MLGVRQHFGDFNLARLDQPTVKNCQASNPRLSPSSCDVAQSPSRNATEVCAEPFRIETDEIQAESPRHAQTIRDVRDCRSCGHTRRRWFHRYKLQHRSAEFFSSSGSRAVAQRSLKARASRRTNARWYEP